MDLIAGLITLVGAVGKTSKLLYELHSKIKDAPDDIQELVDRLKTFYNLLTVVTAQLQDHQSAAPPQDTLQNMWGDEILRMRQDVQCLDALVTKVQPLVKQAKWTTKAMLNARKILDEKKTSKYQKRIEKHCDLINMMQVMTLR